MSSSINLANQVSAGLEADDLHEPGAAWKPVHHHDAEVARTKLADQKRGHRHWKTKMWKRRTKLRQAKAEAFRLAGEGYRRASLLSVIRPRSNVPRVRRRVPTTPRR